MNNFSKRLAGLSLGLLLTLGVGAAVGHHDVVGVKAAATEKTATFDVSKKNITSQTAEDLTITFKQEVTYSSPWRIYSGNDVTISGTSSVAIKTVTIGIDTGKGEIADTGTKTYWSPNAKADSADNPVVLEFDGPSSITYSRAQQVRWSSLSVTYTIDSTAPSVSLKKSSLPAGNLELGATGTLEAETANIDAPTFEWTTSNASVVKIDATSGAYEALAGGTATITCKETTSNLTASVDLIVDYGIMSIADVIALGDSVSSDTSYKVTVRGYLTDLDTAKSSNIFKISDKKADESDANTLNIYGIWSTHALRNIAILNSQITFTGNLSKYKEVLQMKNPVYTDYTIDAAAFANYFVSTLNADACADPTKDNTEALKTAWTDLKAKWAYVDSASKETLMNATAEDATYGAFVNLYDHIMNRYGEAKLGEGANFVGRTITTTTSGAHAVFVSADNSLTITIIVLVSVLSVSLIIGTTLIIRKRKVN